VTIRELSTELGVSEQALRQWCKKNNVRKESTDERKGKKAGYFLDENTIKQIKDYYSGKGNETKASAKGKESRSNFPFSDTDVKQAQIDSLTAQVKTLEAQVEDLRQHNKLLASQLEVKDKQINDITAALTAAQVLHGADKKQLIEADPDQAETEQKRSIFQRLFRRK
jgi:DNA-binding transcriptional MerR regulator